MGYKGSLGSLAVVSVTKGCQYNGEGKAACFSARSVIRNTCVNPFFPIVSHFIFSKFLYIIIFVFENLLIDFSRSSSTRTGASRVAPMSAALNAQNCVPTSIAATQSGLRVVTGWSMKGPITWATSTYWGVVPIRTTSAGWDSTTVCDPAIWSRW